MTRTTADSAYRRLAALIAEQRPSVVGLCAPPGYRKMALLRSIVPPLGRTITCDLGTPDSDPDPAWSITQTLAARDPDRAARAAADRLAQRRATAELTSRDALRAEWEIEAGPELIVFRDSSSMLTSPRSAELLAELLAGFPGSRTIGIASRAPLPPTLRALADRRRWLVVGPEDLALRLDETLAHGRDAGLSEESSAEIHAIAGGWPLVTELLLRSATTDPNVLEAARTVPRTALFGYAVHRTVARLDADVRDALIVTAILGEARHLALIRILGDRCDDAVFAKLSTSALAEEHDGAASVHPEVHELLRNRFRPHYAELYERALRALTGDRAYVAAARVALREGDAEQAAAIVDAAPPYTASPVPIAAYQMIIDRIDRAMITRFPNLWIATIPYRSFAVDAASYVREAETIYFCMPATADRDHRAAVLMILASAYVNFGRTEDADALIEEALAGFAGEASRARASILNFAASVRGIEGRFEAARALAAEAAQVSEDAFGESQTLLYIDAHEAAYRGRQQRAVVILDELLRRRKAQALPLYIAHAAVSGAIFSWASGDDHNFERYLNALEDVLTPGIEPMFGPVVDAARGRPVRFSQEQPWPSFAALAYIYRAGKAENTTDAREAARAAVRAADARRDPYLQVLARAESYLTGSESPGDDAAALARVARTIESPELHAAVDALIAHRPAGMLETLVRRVARQDARTEAAIAVELLTGRVLMRGAEVRMTDKEFELLALLASTRGALSRERIGEALWEHLEPEEWRNNLKVTVYRIRKKVGRHDVIVTNGAGFRLGQHVDVDVRLAETLVRSSSARSDATRAEFRTILERFTAGSAAARYDGYGWGYQLLARIGDLVCRAGEALAGDALLRGAGEEALWAADRIREVDPFNEVACEVRVRIAVERGNLASARQEFKRFSDALAKELGGTPSGRLRRLVYAEH